MDADKTGGGPSEAEVQKRRDHRGGLRVWYTGRWMVCSHCFTHHKVPALEGDGQAVPAEGLVTGIPGWLGRRRLSPGAGSSCHGPC
jgi:hypothetical protein